MIKFFLISSNINLYNLIKKELTIIWQDDFLKFLLITASSDLTTEIFCIEYLFWNIDIILLKFILI